LPILVDSSVWIGYFNGAATPKTDHLDRLLGSETIVVADLIVAEVLQGFREDRDLERAREALLRLPVLEMGGTELALACAENYRLLRRQGVTIRSTVDCWIATFCMREGFELLHDDRDFDTFARHLPLRVVLPRGTPQ
jgi:predicted nucleic acid-binding protein